MNKSIIVYGPHDCGKTRYKERLMKHFGLNIVVDNFNPFGVVILVDTLYLVTCDGPAASGVLACHSFADVAQQINAAIPLTDWQTGEPPMAGEWDASFHATEDVRRWWNGSVWSFHWNDSFHQDDKDNLAGRTHGKNFQPLWRGMSEEPIQVLP